MLNCWSLLCVNYSKPTDENDFSLFACYRWSFWAKMKSSLVNYDNVTFKQVPRIFLSVLFIFIFFGRIYWWLMITEAFLIKRRLIFTVLSSLALTRELFLFSLTRFFAFNCASLILGILQFPFFYNTDFTSFYYFLAVAAPKTINN